MKKADENGASAVQALNKVMKPERISSSSLENAIAVEAAKISTGTAFFLAAAAAASPLAAPLGTVAAVGYGASVVLDWLVTGRFCPLPVCRTTIGDMLTLFGSIQGGEVSPEAEQLLEGSNWLSTYESRAGLEVRPALTPGAMQQILDEFDDAPIVAKPRALPQPTPKQAQTPRGKQPPARDEALEDLWAEETANDISKAFASADQRNRWEKNIREMDEAEERKRQEAIATQEEFENDPQKLHRGLVDVITQPRCCVIYGNPGSGKGIQLSNAIREQKRLYPDTFIFAIDPKNDSKEDGYWSEGFDIVHRRDISQMGSNQAANWLYDRVAEFHRMSGPRLLIWDEVMTSVAAIKSASGEKAYEDGKWQGEWVYRPGRDLFNDINFWATSWVSSGDSRNIRAWFITQSGNLDDLPFTGGTKSQLRQIILARDTDEQLIQKMGQNKTLGRGKSDIFAVKEVCDRSPVGRAIYLSDVGEWLPLAKLPNHSGWDRDKQAVCTG